MSHIVTIATEVRDPDAVAAACRRLGLPEPVHGTASLFESQATGLLVVCRACSIARGCKSPTQPDGGEVLAERKGVAARRGLKEAWSKVAT
jgi:hypothetical protein